MTGSGPLARACAVTPDGAGAWRAELPAGWDVAGVVHGGLVMATAVGALREETGLDPVTVTGHFVSPGRAGAARIETSIVRAGRTLTTARALLEQEGRPVLAVQGSFGPIDPAPHVLLQDAPVPDWPDPESLPRTSHVPGIDFPPPLTDRLDLRLHPDDAVFVDGRPSGVARMRGYLRLLDDEPVDARGLVFAADALPPPTFNANLPVGWTPTVELTVHVRALPAPGWLRIDTGTRFISHGRMEVDAVIWDATGQVVAQARQLALVPRG